MQEVELIALGDVQGVGYRQIVAGIGRRMKLKGCVRNLKDGTVQIRCKGDEKPINEFKEKISRKNPPEAPLIDVEKIEERQLAKGTIKQENFEEIYDDPVAEMSQGFSTGMKYMSLFNRETQENLNLFRIETQENLNLFRTETQENLNRFNKETQENLTLFRTETKASFEHMDEKYDKISQAMYAIAEQMEERNKSFEIRMEKTEKNIESLLKILAEKKS